MLPEVRPLDYALSERGSAAKPRGMLPRWGRGSPPNRILCDFGERERDRLAVQAPHHLPDAAMCAGPATYAAHGQAAQVGGYWVGLGPAPVERAVERLGRGALDGLQVLDVDLTRHWFVQASGRVRSRGDVSVTAWLPHATASTT
jgi:hypothetical protein